MAKRSDRTTDKKPTKDTKITETSDDVIDEGKDSSEPGVHPGGGGTHPRGGGVH